MTKTICAIVKPAPFAPKLQMLLKSIKNSAPFESVDARLRKTAHFIESRDLESALKCLEFAWNGVNTRPEIIGLSNFEKGKVLHLCGYLNSLIGTQKRIPNTQGFAKDLISEGASLLLKEDLAADWAMARCDLAFCYMLEGAYHEASIILADALNAVPESNFALRSDIIFRQVTSEFATYRFEEALILLLKSEPVFSAARSPQIMATFHIDLGFVYAKMQDQGLLDDGKEKAIDSLLSARAILESSDAIHLLGRVENNLSVYYTELGNVEAADECLNRALLLFKQLNDRFLVASCLDTKAQLKERQGRFDEALEAAAKSVEILSEGDEKVVLSESQRTLARLYNKNQFFEKAFETYMLAAENAEKSGLVEEAADALLLILEEIPLQFHTVEKTKIIERIECYLIHDRITSVTERLNNLK